jgi:hypothetical protein
MNDWKDKLSGLQVTRASSNTSTGVVNVSNSLPKSLKAILNEKNLVLKHEWLQYQIGQEKRLPAQARNLQKLVLLDTELKKTSESPRVLRRLRFLREWSHYEQTKSFFPGS